MTSKAPQIPEVVSGELANAGADFTGKLDAGEVLTGTPTVDLKSGAELPTTLEQVNTEPVEIDGVMVPTGQAVLFQVDATNAVKGTRVYRLTCTTSKGQRRKGDCAVEVIE